MTTLSPLLVAVAIRQAGPHFEGHYPVMALALLLMLVFLMLTLGKLSCVSARSWIAVTPCSSWCALS